MSLSFGILTQPPEEFRVVGSFVRWSASLEVGGAFVGSEIGDAGFFEMVLWSADLSCVSKDSCWRMV